MIAVIAAALVESLTDGEVRRYFRLPDGEPVTVAKRRKMAGKKAGMVYAGMLAAFVKAVSEVRVEVLPDGAQQNKGGGLNFGGVLKIGVSEPLNMNKLAIDESGAVVQKQKLYQRETIANGFYAVGVPLSVPGCFRPWFSRGEYGGYVAVGAGDIVAGKARVGGSLYQVDGGPFGHRGADGVTRCWVYVDPVTGRENRVEWVVEQVKAVGRGRIKSQVMDAFWCELNGLSWADLAVVGKSYTRL